MKIFWIDAGRGQNIAYEEFVHNVTKEGPNKVYIKEKDPYFVYTMLIRNLLNDKKSIILDADFSEEELNAVGLSNNLISDEYYQENLHSKFPGFHSIIKYLEDHGQKHEIQIYTSGTTGKPKSVTQTLANLVRAVQVERKYQENVWGFAYNPTHFAGLQVFFQALYNKNTIVFVFERDFSEVYLDLKEFAVTHLSCTPTFMKLLIGSVTNPLSNVRVLTFGGERFDPKILDKVKKCFPNAKVNNVYASTEAGSLLRSQGAFFSIPKRYKELIKIEEQELLIHHSLLGSSSTFKLDGDWYRTGDYVEIFGENEFVFKNRKSDLINVGGYKVNPVEVEKVISSVPDVLDVLVTGRKNSLLGNVIIAQVISKGSRSQAEVLKSIKDAVSAQLQDFKRPHKIKFVQSFDLTRTGKIRRT